MRELVGGVARVAGAEWLYVDVKLVWEGDGYCVLIEIAVVEAGRVVGISADVEGLGVDCIRVCMVVVREGSPCAVLGF